MSTITDFDLWLSDIDPDDHHEVYALYNAVKNGEDSEPFKCTKNESQGKYFVSCGYIAETLMLGSEKARQAFLQHIEDKYAGKGYDIESWYGYKCAMERND